MSAGHLAGGLMCPSVHSATLPPIQSPSPGQSPGRSDNAQGMRTKEAVGQCDAGGGLATTEESSNAPRFTFT